MEIPATYILVFQTNLHHLADQQRARPFLDGLPHLHRWTLDDEDVDCVLRIESGGLTSDQVEDVLTEAGFFCRELPD